jgi:hypothetical protein
MFLGIFNFFFKMDERCVVQLAFLKKKTEAGGVSFAF